MYSSLFSLDKIYAGECRYSLHVAFGWFPPVFILIQKTAGFELIMAIAFWPETEMFIKVLYLNLEFYFNYQNSDDLWLSVGFNSVIGIGLLGRYML